MQINPFFKSLQTDSKQFQMVQTYPSMSLETFVNVHVIKLILHNLGNTGFLVERRSDDPQIDTE